MNADDKTAKPSPQNDRSGQELTLRELMEKQKLAAQLLREENLLAQAGGQKYYMLPKDAAEQLLSSQPDGENGEFSLTRVWRREAPEIDNKQDALLKEMAARLQAIAGGEAELSTGKEDVDWQYGDQIHILPNSTAVDEFLSNLPSSQPGEFSQTQLWTKPTMVSDSKQEKLLGDISRRLEMIETQLRRLERYFNPDSPAAP